MGLEQQLPKPVCGEKTLILWDGGRYVPKLRVQASNKAKEKWETLK